MPISYDTDIITDNIQLLTKNSGYLISLPSPISTGNTAKFCSNSVGHSIRSSSSMSGISSSNTSSSSSLSISTNNNTNTTNTSNSNVVSPNKTLISKSKEEIGHTSLNTEIYYASSMYANRFSPTQTHSLFSTSNNNNNNNRDKIVVNNPGMFPLFLHFIFVALIFFSLLALSLFFPKCIQIIFF